MRTSFAKRSAPTLAARQRRRQIIDLLAGHLARMPYSQRCLERGGPLLNGRYRTVPGVKDSNLRLLIAN